MRINKNTDEIITALKLGWSEGGYIPNVVVTLVLWPLLVEAMLGTIVQLLLQLFASQSSGGIVVVALFAHGTLHLMAVFLLPGL